MKAWNIFALDPALSCGWAYSRGKWGVQHFIRRPWRHPFAHFLDFRAWLLERVETLQINAIAFEGALSAQKGHSTGSRLEWQGVIHSVAAECDLPVLCVYPSSLKKYATGHGHAERPAMRQALLERFKLDLPEDEHDAIAAIWVLSWATSEAQDGRLLRDWSGFPPGDKMIGRDFICNRCQQRYKGGQRCPRCGWSEARLEA